MTTATPLPHQPAEAELWADGLPDDVALEKLAETEADTPEMQRLRRERKRVNERLIRDMAVKQRNAVKQAAQGAGSSSDGSGGGGALVLDDGARARPRGGERALPAGGREARR